MKLTKTRIIAAVAIIALLCIAFFASGTPDNSDPADYGGDQYLSATADISIAPAPSDNETYIEKSLTSPKLSSPSPVSETDTPAPTESDNPREILTAAETVPAAALPQATPPPAQEEPPNATPLAELTCTLSISCSTILDNLDKLAEGKESLIPENGWLFYATDIAFNDGDTVFDVLKRELKSRTMHLEFTSTPALGTVYIEGICNIYEFDCGELSGWQYKVNGVFSGVGCSLSELSDGDVIEWMYTCDMGRDIGAGQF